ncbi:restriction endonuclease subunit S [Shewanella sp. 3B26]|uniref:Restriction endonuclease subunit S n=1 Tax=Shewanella zhuhaiensis TaxID=2919576 RepID=A0AAJ1BK51_9GAMM|nr:restriction endonuclease subunit S [Shewanella zhuhaiensis]
MSTQILENVAEIRAGHPFRGAIHASKKGNGYVIQIRDQDEEGKITWGGLTRAEVSGRNEPEWLSAGDIVFAARGLRNLATEIPAAKLERLEYPVVCSPHYFQIRINEGTPLLPEFLAWQLNQAFAQKYFQQSAVGSAQVSIRRTVLAQTPITLPEIETQQRVVHLSKMAAREEKIYQQLIELRRLEMSAIAKQILTEHSK